jgi:hypothetical protein
MSGRRILDDAAWHVMVIVAIEFWSWLMALIVVMPLGQNRMYLR